MLKYSRYNHLVRIPDEEAFALVNFRTGAVARLSPVQKIVFEQAEDLPVSAKAIQKLRQGGFLVDYDELRHMRTQIFSAGGTGRALGLTICPTLACNFRCPYCFEQARGGRMTPEVQDAIVAFAQENMEKFALHRLTVTWFGGEPLLCPDIIENLSVRLMGICQKLGASYAAGIFTNGWFLTEENLALLERAKVTTIQMTLDGATPETNDHLRREAGGGSSFARIMENIKKLRPYAEDKAPHVIIRYNMNRENAPYFGALAAKIEAAARETGVDITAYPAKMDSSIENPQHIRDAALSLDEYGRLASSNAVLNIKTPAHFRGLYCMAQYPHAYAIDELGDLYKCLELVGRQEFVMGNVRSFRPFKEPAEGIENMDRFFETIFPEQDAECMACKAFPLCLGGCPRKRVAGERSCLSLKSDLDGYALARYRETRSQDK
ncbi:radical SAM/SPASM domain-containing protein [Selenomonas ruminantium]|uniref:Radical SAM core domain-containing protein n=1 Tax=Selenomonas ruminantium TaxID=971 RepID=A0A1H0Q7A6_SELRU|nr:radical SAM protein [Selenomonas ruminantium]SDP12915.1 uncharacterized protein SAMN05216366_10719 [Selenomonas ruminantium]